MKGRDLLDLADLGADELETVLEAAASMEDVLARRIKKVPTLRGRSLVTLFFEPSTRTRISFELAGKYLSADVVGVNAAAASVQKGESLEDTARTLEAMGVDAVVLRHRAAGAAELLARCLEVPVINAGDGMHAHPTQGLLDLYTVRRRKGELRGLKVAIIGDLEHSRVARSDLIGLTRLGAQVWVAGPATLLPPGLEGLGARVAATVEEALREADVVMALRLQRERQQQGLIPGGEEYARCFGLNRQRLALAKPDALFLHPMPLNRGVEVTSEVADGAQAVLFDQVRAGVAVRMAVLYLLLGGGN
ncbi:MAG: aspartate carbamoyltransferase catalytic subunit [Thermaerobacter sp.]|nr:aspartate carbamoyltransferase catalytic subunit [Thermaerobacter sp.]